MCHCCDEHVEDMPYIHCANLQSVRHVKETKPQELTAIDVTKEIRLWVNDQLDAQLR